MRRFKGGVAAFIACQFANEQRQGQLLVATYKTFESLTANAAILVSRGCK